VKKGDVLFRIDPEPFQYEVDRLQADMEIKEIILEDADVLASAQVAAEIQRDRAQAAHDQTRALLANARLDLREAVVYAPADGVVTNLSLRPGQIATRMASLPVMTLVATHESIVIATFAQSALNFVRVGDEVEIALDRLPGRVLHGRVEALLVATGQGQLPPSGTLMEWTQAPVPGRMAVRFQLDEGDRNLEIPAGTAGVAAVYTDRATAIQIIRKVVLRMNTWLNYLIL
jgi:multidrug resistance efflux pump